MLRKLRTDRKWTVEYVAQQLLCSPSKVSRLETGHRGASARDIRDLSNLYGVDEQQREHLMELATEGKQRAWWQRLGLPYSTYVGLENDAVIIQDYGLGAIPGLLQTRDYAKAVVQAYVPHLAPQVVEQRVTGRIARQQILSGPDAPRFHAVIDESVLHRVVGSPAIMQTQLRRLLEVAELPNVSLGVVPFGAGALPSNNNKFIILSFAAGTISDVVFIEGLTGDLYLDDPDEVEVYKLAFGALAALAGGTHHACARIIDLLRT